MANKWTQMAVFKVSADTSEVRKELEGVAKEIQALNTKDGVVLNVKVDDKGIVELDKLYEKYNKDGKNVLSFVFDEEATKNSLKVIEGGVEEAFNRITEMVKQMKNLSGDLLGSGGSGGSGGSIVGDISEIDNLKAKLDTINDTIKERQTLLKETQVSIESQANAEINAAKRVQAAYEKWQNKEDKRSAKAFAAEYDDYLSKDYDTSKLDFTTSTGRKQFADQIDSDYYDILDEYEITNEELDKLKASIANKQKDIITYSDDELAKFKNTATQLKSELQSLAQERESLIKDIEAMQKQETAKASTVVKGDTGSTAIDGGNVSSLGTTANVSDSSELQEKLDKANNDINSLEGSIEAYKNSLIQAQQKAKELEEEKIKLEQTINSNLSGRASSQTGSSSQGNIIDAKIGSEQTVNVTIVPTTESIAALYKTIEDYGVANIKIAPESESIKSFTDKIESNISDVNIKLSPETKSLNDLTNKIKDVLSGSSQNLNTSNSIKTPKLNTNNTQNELNNLDSLNAKLKELKGEINKTQASIFKLRNKASKESNENIEAIDKEIDARKRLQDLNKDFHIAGNKLNSIKYASEYDYYTKAFGDTSKIGYTSDNGTTRSPDKMLDDFNKIVEKYNVTKEQLDKSYQLLNQQYNSNSSKDATDYESKIKDLNNELKRLKAEKIQIEKEIKSAQTNKAKNNVDADINKKVISDGPKTTDSSTGIQQYVNDLLTSINSIPEAFGKVTTSVTSDTESQVKSITTVQKAVDALKKSLGEAGIQSVDKFANLEKEFAKLQQEQKKIDKQKKDFENEQAEAKKNADYSTNVLTGSEMINARNKIIEAADSAKNFDIDLSSIKFDKDGIMSFKAVIEETGDAITIAEYKIKDFDKAVTASGKLSKKYLDNNTVGIITNTKKAPSQIDITKSLVQQIKDAAKKTKGLTLDSFKIDDSGFVDFTVTLQKAGEEAKQLQFHVENLNDAINKRGRSAGSFSKSFLESGTDITGQVELEKLTDQYLKAIETRRKIEESGTMSTDYGVQRQAAALQRELELEAELNELKEKANITDEEKEDLQNRINDAKEKELDLYDATETRQSKINQAQLTYDKITLIDPNDYADIDTVVGGQVVNVRDKIIELQSAAAKAMNALSEGFFDSKEGFEQTANALNNIKKSLQEITVAGNQNINSKGSLIGDLNIGGNLADLSQTELKTQIEQLLREQNEIVKDINITKSGSSTATATANVINDGQIKKVTLSLEQYQNALDGTAVKVRALEGAESKYLSSGAKWIQGIKKKFGSLTQYVTGLDMVMRAWNEVQQGLTFVKELDSTLTTIYQTMDITRQGLAELGSGAIQLSKDLGATADQVMDSVDIYAAYGETVDSILNKASPTVMLANAAQTDVATASEEIQAVVQQYKELEGQEGRVVNAYEKIAANIQVNFPKGVQAIAEATQNAGSIAREAGLEFEEFGAIVGTIAEVTRQEGSRIGNAMKTIMSRISRSQSADSDVTAEDRSTTAKAYKEVAGIDLYDENGQYKDLSETLDELASKWNTLTDAQRNYIAEESAGIRNINTFTTMMDNYAKAQELAQAANEDPNYYLEVQEKYMESMQAKLNTLRASMQEFWNSILDTGVINLGIDLLTSVVNVAKDILGIFGSIKDAIGGTTGSIVSFGAALASVYATIKAIENVRLVGTLFGGLGKTGKDATSGIGGIISAITSLFSKSGRSSLFGGLKEVSDLYNSAVETGKNAKNLGILDAFSDAGGGLKGITASFATLAGKIGVSTAALGAFTGALALIGGSIWVFNELTQDSQETAEAVQEANERYQEVQQTLQNQRETIDSVGLEWEILSEGVNAFGQNVSLTTEEFERYQEICNQIADLYPNLVSGYDAQGNAILSLKGNLEELNAEYEKQVVLASQERIREDTSLYQENFNNATGRKSWNTSLADMFRDMWTSPQEGNTISYKDASEALSEIQEMNAEEVQRYINELQKKVRSDDHTKQDTDMYKYLTQTVGIGSVDLSNDEAMEEFAGEWQTLQGEIRSRLSNVNAEISSATNDMRSLIADYWNVLTMGDGEYADMDDTLQQQISTMLSNVSTEQLEKLSDEGVDFKKYVSGFVDSIANSRTAQIGLDQIFNIDEDTSIDKIKEAIEEIIPKLSEELDIDEAELKIQLGLTDDEELVKKYDQVVKAARDKIQADGRATLDELIAEADQAGDTEDLSTRLSLATYRESRNGIGEKKQYDYATTYYDEENDKSIVLTPVLPNGEILSAEQLDEYASEILDGNKIDTNITLATFDGKDSVKQADKFSKSINQTAKKYDDLQDSAEAVQDYIRDNAITTAEQLDLLNKCVQETDSWAEATRQFELQDINLDANAKMIETLTANLEKVEETIGNINDAAEQSHESAGLGAEQIENIVNAFSGLEGYNYDKLFESTAAGVHLNVQELERLNGEYERAEKTKYTDTLEDLEDQYAKLCIQIEEASTVTERNELVSQRNDLEDQISQVQELASRYEGLTNSVTKFQQAMEGGEEGDTYDYIAESAEEIKNLYDEGLTGTNAFKSYVQMMTNQDMSGASNKEYIDMYEQQKALWDSLFTVDEATGAQNFLNMLTGITDETGRVMASYDALNDSWKINNADAAVIAEELGISEAAIAEIFKKLNDFGFNISFAEETDHLKAMREEAEKANQAFNDFSQFEGFEDFKFDLTVTNEDALKEQIDTAEELRKVLINTYGAGSDEVAEFDKQLDYLKATAGQTIDALDFTLNYNDNKEEIDGLINELSKLEKYKDLDINFDTTSVTNVNNQLDDVTDELLTLQGTDGRINLEAEGAAELMDIFIALINKKIELSRPAVATLDINDFSGDYQIVMQMLNDYQTKLETLNQYEALATVDAKYEVNVAEAQAELDEAVQAINDSGGSVAEILAKLELDPGSLTQEQIDTQLATLNADMMIEAGFELTEEAKATMGGVTADATKKIDADTSAADAKLNVLEVKIEKESTKPVKLSVNTTEFDTTIKDKTKTEYKTIVVNEKKGTTVSTGGISGVGRASGTNNKGLPKDETALVGELGSELVVDPATNSWELVGENGAEFRDLKQGQIVFNHNQTKELLKKGSIPSRGKALVNGTVSKFNSLFKVGKGSAYAGGYSGGGIFGYGGSGSNMWSSDKNSKDKADEPKESDFDWIEVLIDRIERAIQRLDTVANSAYKSFTKRNTALRDQFSKVTEEIRIQQQAYEAYMREANAVGLNETYAKKVRDGTLDVETIVDNEELVDQINKYQEL